MSTTNNILTPISIVKKNLHFSIPLYQRLFAWGEDEVRQFLRDLKEHYINLHTPYSPYSPYYLGIITCLINSNEYELIDGQQRITLLHLLALSLREYFEDWKQFLERNSSPRLNFIAREEDNLFLKALINRDSDEEKNSKTCSTMKAALTFIREEVESIENKVAFARAVYKHTTLFVSVLPEEYRTKPQLLNKYFESMNSAGRNLEQHEILKIKLLRKSSGEKQTQHLYIWNKVERLDRMILPRKKDESDADYVKRYQQAIAECLKGKKSPQEILEHDNEPSNEESYESLREIKGKALDPQEEEIAYDGADDTSIVSFSELLLLTLHQSCKEEKDYRSTNLLGIFEKAALSGDKLDAFYRCLLHYRLLMDCYIIRHTNSDSRRAYTLLWTEKQGNVEDKEDEKRLLMYQSMLYVSTSTHLWLAPLLEYLSTTEVHTSNSILKKLKELDENRHKSLPQANELRYKTVNRYWFWLLDYILWDKRETLFDKDEREIVEYYIFRSNRSIEHLHPKDESKNTPWKTEDINSFGNLAMISQSFNSTQSNEHVDIKFARIKQQADRKELQSLKLYRMYLDTENSKDKKWEPELAAKHEKEMLNLLKDFRS